MILTHRGMMINNNTDVVVENSLTDWFANGGLGLWYNVSENTCFSDLAGTIPAVVGLPTKRVLDNGDAGRHVVRSQDTAVKFGYDSSLQRYYLNFTGITGEQMVSSTGTGSNFSWLHDGTEWLAIAKVQYNTQTPPISKYSNICGTGATNTTSTRGFALRGDNRSTASRSRAIDLLVSRGASPLPVFASSSNDVVPFDTPIVQSFAYAHGYAGNDAEVRVNGSLVASLVNSAANPSPTSPSNVLYLGCNSSTGDVMVGRLYALAILRGTGARTNIAQYEADI